MLFGGACTNKVCANLGNCMDMVLNGNETDVDCGGPMCNKCAVGKMCSVASDCTSGLCSIVCLAPAANCSNGVKDGQETDLIGRIVQRLHERG